MWGKPSPKLHPRLRPALAGYPVAFAMGCAWGTALCSFSTVWQGTPTEYR